jgi:hypothetical protein
MRPECIICLIRTILVLETFGHLPKRKWVGFYTFNPNLNSKSDMCFEVCLLAQIVTK